MRRLAALALLCFALSCAREPSISTGQGTGGAWFDEGVNLVSLLRGATIVDRSGELSLEYSSMLAIDGHPSSLWSTPPENLRQWMIVELPATSRIESVGLSISTWEDRATVPQELRYEASLDGETWALLGDFVFERVRGNQMHPVEPADARYIRVTTLKNHGHGVFTHVPVLLVYGEEMSAYQRPSANGHWKLNDLSAHVMEEGSRVFGRIEMDPPMLIEGAWSDRIVRFAWTRGPNYGVGLLTVNPENQILDGLWWYENAVEAGNELGTPWFGVRVGDPAELGFDPSTVAQKHLERAGTFPLFGLIFDESGRFDREASRPAVDFIRRALDTFPQFRVRLEVCEFHSPDDDQNLARAHQRRTSLIEGLTEMGLPSDRLIIEAIGSERPYPARSAPLHWAMYSRVDFSLSATE